MSRLDIVYLEVPSTYVNTEGKKVTDIYAVYRIPRNAVTDTIMEEHSVPFRDVTEKTFDIPGSTQFLRKFNKALRSITAEFEVHVDCSNPRRKL